jgi:hypothetical protein
MKKSVLIILILVILIVLVVAGVLGYYWYSDSRCEEINKEKNIASLKNLKCLSLCPINPAKSEIPDFSSADSSCSMYCDQLYDEDLDKITPNKRAEKIELKCLKEGKLSYYQEDCIGKENFRPCLEEVFNKYSYIVDLSNYKLGNYPKYSISIQNLTCNNDSAEVTIKYLGDLEASEVIFTLIGSGESQGFEKEPINNGESKTYLLPAPEEYKLHNPITEIWIALSIERDGKNYKTYTLAKAYCQ